MVMTVAVDLNTAVMHLSISRRSSRPGSRKDAGENPVKLFWVQAGAEA